MHSKLYMRLLNSKRWRTLRAEILSDEPLCRMCKAEGKVVAARELHHITPIESARTEAHATDLAYSRANIMPLCHEHHKNLHIAERSHSREAHKARNRDRLNQWINKHTKQE